MSTTAAPSTPTASTAMSTAGDMQTPELSVEETTAVKMLKRFRWQLLIIPYLLGIAWTCAHPVVSIITGELKCRGWFVDENSLDAGNFRFDTRLNPRFARRTRSSTANSNNDDLHHNNSMCRELVPADNVECHADATSSFSIAKVVPISNAITPVSEAIVLVIPASSDWYKSTFHNGMIQLIARLASSESSPWLAKTVLIVAPTSTAVELEDVISNFLDAYLGGGTENVMPLPPSYTSAMIRNLIVLDVEYDENRPDNELRILPQGRRGALPNMDLVFLLMTVYARASFMDPRTFNAEIVMHPYNLPSFMADRKNAYWSELMHMLLFAKTLAVGPYAPHAPVLEKGIDALTLRVRISKHPELAFQVVERLEGIVRALSNLHERLHHSLTQYLMPSPYKFVSHSEYLIPNVLILLPCLIRAVSLILVEMEGETCAFDFMALKLVAIAWCAAVLVHQVAAALATAAPDDSTTAFLNGLVLLLYVAIPLFCRGRQKERRQLQQSLQFCACLCVIYVSAPLTVGHVALAFPTSLLFSLLIAVLPPARLLPNAVKVVIGFGTWPPAVLVAQIFGGRYTPYVTLAYLPLHLLLTMIWYIQE